MQAKIKKTNLNKKDRARNMRGVKKYNDKINFIIANNIKIKSVENNKSLKEIKGDKEYKNEESVFDEESVEITKDKRNKEDYKPAVNVSEYKDFNFEILFENDRVIIINKWAGIMVHPDDRNVEVTISDILFEKYSELRLVGDYGRPGIVHRLDRNTTGVLVICKTEDSFKGVKNIFREHKVRKVYRAIVEGNIRDDIGIIDKPMARTRSDFRKKGVVDMYSKDFRGEERVAITKYKVLARSPDKKFTYVEMYPLTGRTHQLRVHMRSIRHPIIGDDLYGSREGSKIVTRSMLHAYSIEFTLRKEEIKVISDIPDDMQKALLDLKLK